MKFSARALVSTPTRAPQGRRRHSCAGVLSCGPCAMGEGCVLHRLQRPRCFLGAGLQSVAPLLSNPMCWDVEMGRRSSPYDVIASRGRNEEALVCSVCWAWARGACTVNVQPSTTNGLCRRRRHSVNKGSLAVLHANAVAFAGAWQAEMARGS